MKTYLKTIDYLPGISFNCDKCETEITCSFTNQQLLCFIFMPNNCECHNCGKKYEFRFEFPIEITEVS